MNVLSSTIKIILISLMLSSCQGIRVKVATDCSWAESFDIPDEMIDYLAKEESPDSAIDLMDNIRFHDELYEKYCLS